MGIYNQSFHPMQLKQLKLAGFKSFVDPATLSFPGPLVAVVGPNGCGKSNIIDAIRWVMGESSAKHLRGDSMTDVIFNGSSTRKPLGQASVELIFDNSLGRLAGPFASYGEIAVKRILTRDGESTYYLNGSRCRRRDVIDIFLGTGAGVRGYSIISQGDISRLIEARPETLRGYLEEAAGISKYKERRRETLVRMRDTRENLTRVADIRDELAKQVQRLEKQGKAAERYLQLKEEERLCRAEILALKWRDLNKDHSRKGAFLQSLEESRAAEQLQMIDWQRQKDLLELKRQNQEQALENIQKAFYLSGTAITRLEENLGQFERENRRLINEKQQLHADHENAGRQRVHYQEMLEKALEQSREIEAALLQSGVEIQRQETILSAEIQSQAAVDQQYDILQNSSNNLKREGQIAEVNWNNNEQQYQQTRLRLEKLTMEAAAMDIGALQVEMLVLVEEQANFRERKMQAEEALQLVQERRDLLQANLTLTEGQLREFQEEHHETKIQHAALSAAQGAARQPAKGPHPEVFANKPRLLDKIQVEKKWRFALEYVLGDQLKALVLDNTEEFLPNISLFREVGESMLTLHAQPLSEASCLSDKIRGQRPALALNLDRIHTVDTLEAAIDYRKHLRDQESVITPEGFWLGQGWIRIPREQTRDESGLLERQEKIAELESLLAIKQEKGESLRRQCEDLRLQLQAEEKNLQELQKNRQACFEDLQLHETGYAVKAERLQSMKTRQQILDEEIRDLREIEENLILKKESLSHAREKFTQEWQALDVERQQLFEAKKILASRIADLKKECDQQKADFQENTRKQDRLLNQIQQMREGIVREEERLDTFHERLEKTLQLAMDNERQEQTCRKELENALHEHQTTETALQACREGLAQEKQALANLETQTRSMQAGLKTLEEHISRERMEEQALALRIQAIEEGLQEYFQNPSDLLIDLADSLTADLRESALSVIMESIRKLGAINLAAIEEYTETRMRKENLDLQYADLQEALTMLESAIEQMDKETQLRMTNTFEEVNRLFQALFPRLFGGGKASLELTSGNLLEAGVVVMAQPPGKRNSSIQLLSGGEKAMTALALVFAIFQLNPSPFCMLDEVDAPLDDVNVGRFCKVVKDMSKFVQFLFITHNKVTMTLAEQLIGVTMREPGVSRLVTVDMIDFEEATLE